MLTKTETSVLRLLGNGIPYHQIAALLGMSLGTVHTHCCHIRRKTGIAKTKDAYACRTFIRENRLPLRQDLREKPTPRQLEVMQMVSNGAEYPEICSTLKLTQSSAQNALSIGCKRAKIANFGRDRKAILREYFKRLEKPKSPMEDPMF